MLQHPLIKAFVIYFPYLALIQVIISTVGSLYYSEILGYQPCTLCWYQRIAIYPLLFIIPIGILRKNNEYIYHVIALSVFGLLTAIYQNLLYYGYLPENNITCSNGVSCVTKYVEYFGFVSIPLLALLSFVIILGLMLIYLRYYPVYPEKPHRSKSKNKQ